MLAAAFYIFAFELLLCATVAFAETTGKQHGSPIQTLEDYDRAILGDPDNARAYNYRGIAYKNIGRYWQEIKDYDEAIRLDPKNAE